MTTPTSDLFSEEILPLPVIIYFLTLILAYKLRHGLIKTNRNLILVESTHGRRTRQGDHFYLNTPSSKFAERDFFYRGLKMFNELDENSKKIGNLVDFKSHLKKKLFAEWLAVWQR